MPDDLRNSTDDPVGAPSAAAGPAASAAAGPAASGALAAAEPLQVDPQLIARSKRLRNILLALIVLVIGVGAALGWYVYNYLLPAVNEPPALVEGPDLLPADDAGAGNIPITVTYEKTVVPNLVALFGLDGDQVLSSLGEGWELTRLAADDPVGDEGDEAAGQLMVLTYTPKITSISGGNPDEGQPQIDENLLASLPNANLYLSLDANGIVYEVVFTADMDVFDYPQQSFIALLGDDSLLRGVLQQAGVSPRDFSYQPPEYYSSLTYDNPDAPNPRVTKQSHIFSGRATNEGSPTAWVVSVTYEFMPPAEDPESFDQPRRILHISLS